MCARSCLRAARRSWRLGTGSGDERAKKAAEDAISSKLLDITIDGARGVLFNVTGGPNMTLFEVNQAAAIIRETAHPDVNMIFGAVIDPNMGDDIRITVIATGFERNSMPAPCPGTQPRTEPRRSDSVCLHAALGIGQRSRGRSVW